MTEQFPFDVFLSHSAKDKAVVRALAERLRKDGVKVWFDEWVLKPGDSIPAKIEEGLEHSRVLVLCMSANAFGSDWAQLEAGTFRFRDPLNKERRFIPLRLDDAPIKGSLAQFLYINWLPDGPRAGVCEAPRSLPAASEADGGRSGGCHASRLRKGSSNSTTRVRDRLPTRSVRMESAPSPATDDKTVRLWDVETGRCLRVFKGHTAQVCSVAWSADQRRALSGVR